MRVLFLLAALLFAVPAWAQGEGSADGPTITVSDDLAALPAPVREKHDALLAAAKSGDIEALGTFLNAEKTRVSFGDPEDPVAYLKTESGDGEGLEVLAFLANILEAPYAVMSFGEGEPSYVWPSFAVRDDLGSLSPAEKVAAYQVAGFEVTQSMIEMQSWLWWRVYFGADGSFQAFVAGD